jgi:hypothetical protein
MNHPSSGRVRNVSDVYISLTEDSLVLRRAGVHTRPCDVMVAIPSEMKSETRIADPASMSPIIRISPAGAATCIKWSEPNTWTVVSRSRLMAMR